MNTLKTALLLGLLSILLVFMGSYLGGAGGAMSFFVIALVINFASYWWSDKLVLKMYRAKPAEETQVPELYSIVRNLTAKANLPMPKLYILPQDTPNAFATGRNPEHAAVAVTSGILRILNKQELEGVLAHELSHVKNRDILIGTIAAAIAGAISLIATMLRYAFIFAGGNRRRNDNVMGLLVMSIIAPISALIIQMAISRSREFQADASAAKLIGSPRGLAVALEKLEQNIKRKPFQRGAQATAHLFIINPFKQNFLSSLFRTHPTTEQRIEKLYALNLN
ncbi:zinc metalloprotease HtpX [bacterium]|nr:zinc metalloprotease HtpX [bacterium]